MHNWWSVLNVPMSLIGNLWIWFVHIQLMMRDRRLKKAERSGNTSVAHNFCFYSWFSHSRSCNSNLERSLFACRKWTGGCFGLENIFKDGIQACESKASLSPLPRQGKTVKFSSREFNKASMKEGSRDSSRKVKFRLVAPGINTPSNKSHVKAS